MIAVRKRGASAFNEPLSTAASSSFSFLPSGGAARDDDALAAL